MTGPRAPQRHAGAFVKGWVAAAEDLDREAHLADRAAKVPAPRRWWD